MGTRVTLDLDPGLGVTQGPDVHHHVHAAGGEVLVVWGPSQADDLCMVPIKYVGLLVAGESRGGRSGLRPGERTLSPTAWVTVCARQRLPPPASL